MTRFERHIHGAYLLSGTDGALVGTAGREINGLDYALDSREIRAREKEILSMLTGVPGERIVMLQQVHGDAIIDVREPPGGDLPWIAEADALVTAVPGLCLVIRTADCIPVFIHDPARRVLGAAHSGWKGTRLGIARATARLMASAYACRPADMRAYVLPGIGPQSYSVGEDVADFFPEDIVHEDGKLKLNLWANIERSLVEEGVPRDSIFMSGICTLLEMERFFSHRGGDGGRNLNFGFLLPFCK